MLLVFVIDMLIFRFGKITSTKAITDKQSNKCKGVYYVYCLILSTIALIIYAKSAKGRASILTEYSPC